MARSNLLKDTVSGQVDLENILLRLKVILSDLEDKDILGWIEGELRGYSEEDIVPDYRIITGRAMGTYIVNGAAKYSNALVPLHFTAMDKDMIDKMHIINVRDGISTIEKNLKSKNRDRLGRPVPTELCHAISSYELQIVGMDIMFAANDFEAILSNVKDKIVDIVMMLEKNFGTNAIDEMDISEQVVDEPEKRNKAITYIHQVVYNDTSTSIEIGDRNKFRETKVGRFWSKNK
ncbi:AbiTii domain-containing protein [Neobacillus kokaensis]|uniref:AbiTii domain-containing protein n=1 Tax=Neobacillus kokaensis TaxID=2759023 RepID=A0ABQ3N6W0_9BACI|nr:hypothetical protein [Neobacillus kokaensis]GHH99718.1 hypothetical protein AM1BK_32610 [Neobacillus kokaensis]